MTAFTLPTPHAFPFPAEVTLPATPAVPPLVINPLAWSTEHLMLKCVLIDDPRDFARVMRVARDEYPELAHRLGDTDRNRTIFNQNLRTPGYVKLVQHGTVRGFVLTEPGRSHLKFLWRTQVLQPYLSRVRDVCGEDVARDLAGRLLK